MGAARWLPFLIGCAAIFVVSSLQRPPIPEALTFWNSDKLLHATAYALLCALALLGSGRSRPFLALLLTVAWGASDEVHQAFVPGREASFLDLLADGAGACFTVLAVAASSRRARRQPS